MKLTSRITATCLLLLTLARANPQNAPEQTSFSAEEFAVKSPVQVPADVLTLLAQDKQVHEALFAQRMRSDQLPSSWFSASSTRLGPRSIDLILEGQGPLRGADAITFWIVLTNPHGHRLVLSAPARDLTIENHRSHGYRDLKLTSTTAVDISATDLRFNGHQYVLYRQKTEPIQ